MAAILLFVFLPGLAYAQTSLAEKEATIAEIFNEGEILAYQDAATLFLDMLHQAAMSPAEDERDGLTHHLGYMLLIMPKNDGARKALKSVYEGSGRPEDSQTLVSWWHRQDPLPATLHNERLEEHLYRVYYAKRNFAARNDSLGLDDRGRIYIRLGDPFRQTSIKLRTAGLRMQPYEGTLPRNEIWVYRGLHDDAHYLFVQQSRRRPFRLGSTDDLVPPNLRANRRKTTLLLTWLEDILGQLTLEHPHYGVGYDEVTNYLTLPTSNARPPYYFAKLLIEDLRLRDDHHQRNRESNVPAWATQVYGIAHWLEPSIRWARFLRPDSTTELEVYWSLNADQLSPRRRLVNRLRRDGHSPSEDYLMVVTGTHRQEDFAPATLNHRFYRFPAVMTGSLPVHTWQSTLNGDMQNLAIQWQQYWTTENEDGRMEPTATLGIGVVTMDSIQALRSDGFELEMSDIRPVTTSTAGRPGRITPYPGRKIDAEISLGLYFELYHLMYDDQNRTRYEVAYTIRSSDRANAQPITAATTYEGTGRVVQEQLMIDLGAWDLSGPVTISVRATDLVLGASQERSVDFVYEN